MKQIVRLTCLGVALAALGAAARKPPRAKPGAAITVAYLMQTLAEIRPPHSIIVEEAPTSRSDMQTYLPINRSEGFYTCSSGGLGHGLPAAIGVALGKPVQKVIALIGDGSSMYAIQGLWSAGQLQVPIEVARLDGKKHGDSTSNSATHNGRGCQIISRWLRPGASLGLRLCLRR